MDVGEIMEEVLSSESCSLDLNYAWFHMFACLLQFGVLSVRGRTSHFRLAHAFGLFALVMDYGVMFLERGTRTISYPGYDGNLDAGLEPLGPLGEFLFFLWFDYSAFGIILWALCVEETLACSLTHGAAAAWSSLRKSPIDLFSLAIVPVQFWTAPFLAPALSLDTRQLILTRESPKIGYGVMLPLFVLVLRFVAQMEARKIVAVGLSGVGCGLVHHAALFTFGMRGYASTGGLVLTLATEVCSVAFTKSDPSRFASLGGFAARVSQVSASCSGLSCATRNRAWRHQLLLLCSGLHSSLAWQSHASSVHTRCAGCQ